MLDIKLLREQPDVVRTALKNRNMTLDLDPILALDQARRERIAQVEDLKQQRNKASKEIGAVKKAGGDAEAQMKAVREIGDQISSIDEALRELEEELEQAVLTLPNIPASDAPVGPDESANRVVRSWSEPRSLDFEARPHWEVGEALGLFDLERAARMTGAGFPLFIGYGARLERALIQFMLDLHTTEHGYTEMAPPFLCNRAAMTGTGQLPKMEEDMYHFVAEDLFLIPTAEVPVTNYYREEIIEKELPVCFAAYTPCFRREAGAAGRDTRGLIRVHQFDKVEMVKFVKPETSYEELEKLVGNAETVLQKLDLPYRVLELCTGDLSFAAAKCYDLEVWAPGHQDWLEVSSCSNFEDFQARRARIRYRNEKGKPEFVHTLNGSGTALARVVVALLENYQEEDGSVRIPDVLVPYMGGISRLTKSG